MIQERILYAMIQLPFQPIPYYILSSANNSSDGTAQQSVVWWSHYRLERTVGCNTVAVSCARQLLVTDPKNKVKTNLNIFFTGSCRFDIVDCVYGFYWWRDLHDISNNKVIRDRLTDVLTKSKWIRRIQLSKQQTVYIGSVIIIIIYIK